VSKLAGSFEFVILRGPHLVLADAEVVMMASPLVNS